jgi:sugar phosphate isomerase/epimerase
MFKYSVNTNSLRNQFSIQEIVNISKDAGADGIEWGIGPLEDAAAQAEEMQRLTEEAGLEVMGFINAGQLWKEDLMRQWSEAVAGRGGKTLRVAHPWFGYNFDETLHQRETFMQLVAKARAGLEMLVGLSREYDIKYVLEMHGGSVAASPWAIYELMRGLDPNCIGAIYDPANTVLEGFVRPRGACELIGEHMAYVHAKNLKYEINPVYPEIAEPRRVQWKYSRTFLDQGLTDYVEIFFALKCIKWSGWISLEEFVTTEYVREISDAITFLKSCAAAAPAEPCEPYTTFND